MFSLIKKIGKKEGVLLIFLTFLTSFGVSFLGNVDMARSAFFTNCSDTATTGISQVQCEALEDLYDATSGDNWSNNTNWGTDTAVNTWEGVYLNGVNIDILVLDNNNLTGTVPDSIEDLNALVRLDLGDNNLFGTIPPEIGTINSLMRVYLDSNDFTGGIPSSFGNLPNLERLYLDHNNLTGTLPITVGSFPSLRRLLLGGNNLTGSIPAEIGGILTLESLYIEQNQLTGIIPAEIGMLTNLTEIWLDHNELTGNIPTTIGALTGMRKLFLNNNQLTGPIPTEIEDLVLIDYLNLSENQLDGVIPNGIGNLTELQNVYLQENQLVGPLPPTLVNLTELIRFYLHDNALSGPVPDLSGFPLLNYFSLSENNFVFEDFEAAFPTYSGYTSFSYMAQGLVDTERIVPSVVGEVLTITPSVTLNANDQYQWYKDGVLIDGATAHTYTKISHAEDTGVYTYRITNTVVGVEFDPDYYLQSNEITVTMGSVCLNGALTIPPTECAALETLYDSTGGLSWGNSTNWKFSPDVSTWYGVTETAGFVTAIDLSTNTLTGMIPSEIEGLTTLSSLNLNGNIITGQIPTEIENLAATLAVLDLGNNQLTGTLSPELLNLTNLTTLYLYGNSLSGGIPDAIDNLAVLTQLGLSDNAFTGVLPTLIGNMTTLSSLNLSGNRLTGVIPVEIGTLTNLTELSLANNNLEGAIPTELGNIGANLTMLNLSGNAFTEGIPVGIASLVNLTELILTDNQLSGTIDASLLGLTNLVSLSLGGNDFLGDFPDFTTLGALANLDIHDNHFSFGDFETELAAYSALTSFVYSPQKKVDEIRSVNFVENEIFKLTPQIALNASGNDQYKWYKDGLVIPGYTERIYTATAEADDEGIYYYRVTNTNFVDGALQPTLTLVSNDITVSSGDALALIDCDLEAITGVPRLECEALKSLYSATNGSGWSQNTYWGRSTNIGSWYGVTVEGGHVTKLDLRNNNLNGLLPASIATLTGLQELLLSDNTLYGSLPDSIGDLVNLTVLNLSGNNLGGGLPATVGSLINLTSLMLSNNGLTGPVPIEIGNLVNLEILYLDRNQFSCDLPAEIVNLLKLRYQLGLQVYSNNLTIPADVTSDFYLFLERVSARASNHFTTQNAATCSILNQPPVSIVLSDRTIDEGLATDTVVGNITGYDPDNVILTFTLVAGDGDTNNASFRIVDNAGTMELRSTTVFNFETKFNYSIRINVSDGLNNYSNTFEITINDVRDNEFLNCTTQTYVPISECNALVDFYNALDGDNSNLNWKTEPDITDWNNLKFDSTIQFVDADFDGVAADVDLDDADPCSPNALHVVCLDQDRDGTPALMDTDDADACVPNAAAAVCLDADIEGNVIELSGQALRGEIPSSISDLQYLQVLKLDNNNNITGEIPTELGNLVYLKHLYLANNTFRGVIPVELAKLSELITLSLSRNKLRGTIPTELGELTDLRYLHLFDNKFSCRVPDSFRNLRNLIDGDGLRIHDNQIIVPVANVNLASFLVQKSPVGEALFSKQENPYCGEVPTALESDSLSVTENQPIETLVGNLTTKDEDDTTFTYTFVTGEGDTDNNSFKLVGSTLVTSEIFDYETKNAYTIRINTTDGDNNLEKAFEIMINDGNFVPTDIYLSSNIIPEAQILKTPIGTFTVEDDTESNTYTYTLVAGLGSTDNASFLISGEELQTNRIFDFDVQSAFAIRVNVNDGVNNFEKSFIISISSDTDGDGTPNSDDTNPTDPCIPSVTSMACLSLDRDNDHVADGADEDPNDPCIPDSGSEACRSKWGTWWDFLYGDGIESVSSPEVEFNACGQSCRYARSRYEGGSFKGATGKDGSFRAGDWITYVPPTGHPLESYYVNYSKIGIFGATPANESVQIRPGYIDHEKIELPLRVENGEGRQIVILRSPTITIDNKAARYRDKGVFLGGSGKDGAFMEGDEIRYMGPINRVSGDRFEVDFHEIGYAQFLAERRPYILDGIRPLYGKYLDVYITAIDSAGNEGVFLGPRIWFGVVDTSIVDLIKPSAPKVQVKKETVKKVPQKNKNPFFRPEDPYDMILRETLEEQTYHVPEKKEVEILDIRETLKDEFRFESSAPVIENPFPVREIVIPSLETRMLRDRLNQQKFKPSSKKEEPFDIREYIDGLK